MGMHDRNAINFLSAAWLFTPVRIDDPTTNLICFTMPTQLRKKNSDYLRFRPYRAFTPAPEKTDRSKLLWHPVVIVGAMLLLTLLALGLIHR